MGLQISGFSNVDYVGSGAFGKVYRGREKSSGRTRAIKTLPLGTSAITEMEVLRCLPEHPHIINYIRYFISEEHGLCLVMEYCSGGNLNDYLLSHQPKSSRDLRFMREIASAVAFLHRNRIVHRDLKPDNILLTSNGTLKVADFGIAKLASDSQHGGSLYNYYMTSACGHKLYMAPEVFVGRSTEKADVFQMGIIFASILERTVLNIGDKRTLAVFSKDCRGDVVGLGQALQDGILPHGFKLGWNITISQELRMLVEGMLECSYRSRPTSEDVDNCLDGIQEWNDGNQEDVIETVAKAVVVGATVLVGAALLGTLIDGVDRRRQRDSDIS